MEWHAWLRAGSRLLMCVDRSYTGHAVVLMVAGFAPHFVFDSFLRILFRADVLCMCSL